MKREWKIGTAERSFIVKGMKPRAAEAAGRWEGAPVVTQIARAMAGRRAAVKRLVDIVLSMVLLILFSPVFWMTALLVALTSPGPIIFTQERVGLYRRKFPMLKFRTMVPDAEARQGGLEGLNEMSGPVFKIRSDPRLTGIGSLLRRTSIDELPQLINVLNGDMSLVGPRPLPIRDVQGFTKGRHQRRFSVLPGMTCLWQVMGRNRIPFDEWMELDLEYIDHWSLALDFKILARTVPAVLKGAGAA